jgi:parallel beta-helix repeat protein
MTLNVKTGYGAAGDGVTDDTAAVASALAALNASTGGEELYFPAGTYLLSGTGTPSDGILNVNVNNATIRGDGIGRSILKVKNSQAADVTGVIRTKSGSSIDKLTVRDLSIDGNKANQTKKTIGFYAGVTPQTVAYDSDAFLLRVEVYNCTDYGFDPHERCTRFVFNGCIAHDNGLDGFTFDGCYGLSVINCSSFLNGRHGINLVTGSANVAITNCIVNTNGSNGIMLQTGAKKNTIVGCQITNNTGCGIQVNGVPQASPEIDTAPAADNSVVGNVILLNGTHGIQLSGSSKNLITGNQIRDNSQTTHNTSSGVYLAETTSGATTYYSTNNLVTSNVIRADATNKHKYNVREQSASDDSNFVDGNRLVGAATANFSLLGANSTAISTAARNPA